MIMMNYLKHKDDKVKELLHYTACGLDDVYLVSGYEIKKTHYGDGIAIKNLDELNNAIGSYLVTEKRDLSGKELRFLRKQLDLTQGELGQLMELSDQQVARWEKDKCGIKGAAASIIRFLYIEHLKGKLKIRGLLETLEEKPALVNQKHYFENTSKGWINKPAELWV